MWICECPRQRKTFQSKFKTIPISTKMFNFFFSIGKIIFEHFKMVFSSYLLVLIILIRDFWHKNFYSSGSWKGNMKWVEKFHFLLLSTFCFKWDSKKFFYLLLKEQIIMILEMIFLLLLLNFHSFLVVNFKTLFLMVEREKKNFHISNSIDSYFEYKTKTFSH